MAGSCWWGAVVWAAGALSGCTPTEGSSAPGTEAGARPQERADDGDQRSDASGGSAPDGPTDVQPGTGGEDDDDPSEGGVSGDDQVNGGGGASATRGGGAGSAVGGAVNPGPVGSMPSSAGGAAGSNGGPAGSSTAGSGGGGGAPGPTGVGGSAAVVEEPIVLFEPNGKVFDGSLDVELGTTGPGEVRFTVDGSTPDAGSPLYDGPISLSQTTIVRVALVVDGVIAATDSQAYFLAAADVVAFSSNLPLVVVDSLGHDIDAEIDLDTDWPRRTSYLSVLEHASGRTSILDAPQVSGRAGIKVRGNSSRREPKKQYSVEFWDELDDDRSRSVLGMPQESDWVLNAPYYDRSLMRDYLAYKWSRDLGFYAARCRFVEVFFNQGDAVLSMEDYVGVYVLMEKVKRDADRVAVSKMAETDLAEPEVSGGYILKVDPLKSYESSFVTARGTPPLTPWNGFLHEYPAEDDIAPEQRSWIQAYLDAFENALESDEYEDPANGYPAYIDEDSFIHYHLMAEALKNVDSYYASMYLHKERGGLLGMGPIWDFNVSLGGRTQSFETDGWMIDDSTSKFWYPRLLTSARYRSAFVAKWTEARSSVLATSNLQADIDAAEALLAEAAERNFTRWPILGQPFGYSFVDIPEHLGHLAFEDATAFLRSWVAARMSWLDANVDSM